MNSVRSDRTKVQLIIAIDYGTSFSGAAYTLFLNRPLEPKINVITDWPYVHHHHRFTQKVPSDIAYDDQSNAYCGFDFPEGTTRIRWAKLLLETDPSPNRTGLLSSDEVQEARRALLTLDKTPIEVVSDYLRWLWNHITECICEEQNDEDLIRNSDVTIIMTVPAMWSDAAKQNTLQAAEFAGLCDNGVMVKFLTEPEAAAISELQTRLTNGQLRRDDCVIICDAGGGTVDLVSYQIAGVNPMELNQIVIAEGDLCGSIYIDDAFSKQITGILQDDWDKLPRESKRELLDRFAYVLKPDYNGPKNARPHVVQLTGTAGLDLEHIESGRVLIEPHLVGHAFENVLPHISNLIDNQNESLVEIGLGQNLKGILLVGGLGSSRFVHSRIEDSFPRDEGVKVWRGKNSWTSVVEGAVRCAFLSLGNIHTVNTRLCQRNYGITYQTKYNPKVHEAEDSFLCPVEKVKKVRRIEWLVRKGQKILPDSAPEKHNFTQIVHEDALTRLDHEISFTVYQSDEDDAPSRFTKNVKECAEIECKMPWRLAMAARHRQIERTSQDTMPAWKVIIQLEIHVLAATVEFQIKMADRQIGKTLVKFAQPNQSSELLEQGDNMLIGSSGTTQQAAEDTKVKDILPTPRHHSSTDDTSTVQNRECVSNEQPVRLASFEDYRSKTKIRPADKVAVVLPYHSRDTDEFDLERGDVLEVVSIWNDGWALGVHTGQRAEDYCQECEVWFSPRQFSDIGRNPASQASQSMTVNKIKTFPLACVCLVQEWQALKAGSDPEIPKRVIGRNHPTVLEDLRSPYTLVSHSRTHRRHPSRVTRDSHEVSKKSSQSLKNTTVCTQTEPVDSDWSQSLYQSLDALSSPPSLHPLGLVSESETVATDKSLHDVSTTPVRPTEDEAFRIGAQQQSWLHRSLSILSIESVESRRSLRRELEPKEPTHFDISSTPSSSRRLLRGHSTASRLSTPTSNLSPLSPSHTRNTSSTSSVAESLQFSTTPEIVRHPYDKECLLPEVSAADQRFKGMLRSFSRNKRTPS